MSKDKTQNKGRNESAKASASKMNAKKKKTGSESKADNPVSATDTESTQVTGMEGKSSFAIASIGLLVGVVALVGLILKPDYQKQVDSLQSEVGRVFDKVNSDIVGIYSSIKSLEGDFNSKLDEVYKSVDEKINSDIEGISKSVQSLDNKIKEVDDVLGNLNNRFGNLERTRAVIELRRMLNIFENMSQNIPEFALEKTEMIQENIKSILADIESKVPVLEETPQNIAKETEPTEPVEVWGDYKVKVPAEWTKDKKTEDAATEEAPAEETKVEEWGDYKVKVPTEWTKDKKTEEAVTEETPAEETKVEEWGDYKVKVPAEWTEDKKTEEAVMKEAPAGGDETGQTTKKESNPTQTTEYWDMETLEWKKTSGNGDFGNIELQQE